MSAQPKPTAPPIWRARPMLRTDLEQVVRVEREIYPFPWTAGNFADSLDARYDAWMFEFPDALAGYAIVMRAPDEAHLLNLGVAAPYQGRGLGRSLLEWLAGDAARRGARAMLLEVRPSNLRALRLYETAGFERIGLRRAYYPAHEGSREDALVLKRVLGDG